MYDRSQKGYFTLCIIRLSGRCFFVAGKLPTFLRLLTYRFESQYHSEYLRKKEILSLAREWHKETVDSTRKIDESSMVIGWMNKLEFARCSQDLYSTTFTFPSNFTVRMKEESAD